MQYCHFKKYTHILFAEMFDMKVKYDESDNVLVRMTRTVTDKVTGIFGQFYINLYMGWVE